MQVAANRMPKNPFERKPGVVPVSDQCLLKKWKIGCETKTVPSGALVPAAGSARQERILVVQVPGMSLAGFNLVNEKIDVAC
ncbi:hypothetical protein M0534_01100 [Methylonatrum kenyense]|uniref:hypothetical protein n=1 Tax=Methylonatrum kenyense TaxID=455253 RepID=UPI0020C12F1B|nr:hypothetical protein [Methylonatrum kenyense]MCK8514928.1 hypothetical protein [Methylonatrum kenyense]